MFHEFIISYKYELDDIMFISFNDMLTLIKTTIQLTGDINSTNTYYTYLHELLMKGIRKEETHSDNKHSHLISSNQNIIE